MEIRLKCECGQILKIGSEAAGKMGKCPACKSTLQIPTLEEIEHAQQGQAAAEEAAPPAETEEPPARKPRAPARSKTRSKALADVRGGKEERRRGPRAAGKAARRGRGRRGRTKSSVLDKYRRRATDEDEDEDERGYAPRKKNPLKKLIVAGVVVIGGLIALFAFYLVPHGRAVARTEAYCRAMDNLVRDVRVKMVQKYGREDSKIPGGISIYGTSLRQIKESAGFADEAMSERMVHAYQADDIMIETIKILEEALTIIKERVEADRQGTLTEEKHEKLDKRFSDKIQEAGAKVADIKALVNSVWNKIR